VHGNAHGDDIAVYEKFIVVFSENSNSQHIKENQEILLYQVLTSFSVAEFIFMIYFHRKKSSKFCHVIFQKKFWKFIVTKICESKFCETEKA
jgi:hypothetical protein